MFFGTPHRGVSVAAVGEVVSKVAGFLGSRADLVAALRTNEYGLQEVAEDFSRISGNYSIKSFYETSTMRGMTVKGFFEGRRRTR